MAGRPDPPPGPAVRIWIEAEALAAASTTARDRPELMARGGDRSDLGYVCLAAPAGRRFVTDAVSMLIRTAGAGWLKWDFNLDPGLGCARDDHGHAPQDGLVGHYRALYAIFDELRDAFPDTVVEACSSGGLRVDAGMAEHVDAFFLSDPDWTEHALQCLWGACRLLPPRQILHWMQSEFRIHHRFQKVDYSGSLLTVDTFDTTVRAALLHRFGLSARLTRMRPDLRARLADHLALYRTVIRPLVDTGILRPLGDQPLREERGNRLPAFQLSGNGDDAGDHVIAAFRLPPAEEWEPVRPTGLDPDVRYRVQVLMSDVPSVVVGGAELLADGIPLPDGSASSTLVRITAEAHGRSVG